MVRFVAIATNVNRLTTLNSALVCMIGLRLIHAMLCVSIQIVFLLQKYHNLSECIVICIRAYFLIKLICHRYKCKQTGSKHSILNGLCFDWRLMASPSSIECTLHRLWMCVVCMFAAHQLATNTPLLTTHNSFINRCIYIRWHCMWHVRWMKTT